jgi:hypothetical protein
MEKLTIGTTGITRKGEVVASGRVGSRFGTYLIFVVSFIYFFPQTEEVLGAGSATDMRYSALRCDIHPLGPGTAEYES